MDSKNIYSAAHHMQRKVTWDFRTGNEWFYFGDVENLNVEKAQKLINNRFSEDLLYFVDGRRNSFQIAKTNVAVEIKSRLHNQNILVCSLNFRSIFEIHHIGSARYGTVSITEQEGHQWAHSRRLVIFSAQDHVE